MKSGAFIIAVLIMSGEGLASGQQTSNAQPVPETLVAPAGTIITVRVRDFISTKRNRVGDGFTAQLEQPIVADGWVLARFGQTVIGRVSSIDKGGRVRGVSELGIELVELSLVDGQQLPIRTQLVEAAGERSRSADAGVITTGAVIGAAVGAVAGRGTGAVSGAAAGGAAATAGVLSTRGKPAEVQPETLLSFRLDAPLAVSTVRSRQAFLPVTAADYQQVPTLRVPAAAPVSKFGTAYPPYPAASAYFGYPYSWYWPEPYFIGAPAIFVARPFGFHGGQVVRRHR